LFRTFGGFLHVSATQIYCLTGARISETHITNIDLKLQPTILHNDIYMPRELLFSSVKEQEHTFLKNLFLS
jgi:hypothetical protein